MKKHLLFLSIACMMASAAVAQNTFDTAIEAQSGTNKYTVTGDQSQTVYWKYTADKNCLATVAPLTGSAPSVGILKSNDGTDEMVTMKGATVSYPTYAYPMQKGTTYYFSCTTLGETGFTLNVEEDDNISGGITSDAPAEIVEGKQTFLGDPFSTSYSGYSAYATYTATETGQLVLSSSGYMNVTVNGSTYTGEYAGSSYTVKVGVEQGTYSITFNNIYSPLLVTASIAHPTAGSVDMPFEGKDGENTVPAAYGKYYYTYTPQSTGFLTVKSDNALPGGTVAIYNGKTAYSPLATSEQGSYNVRTEVAYTGYTYYIVVDKIDDTDTPETFTIAMEDYKAGEKESNPIVISEFPSTYTLESATGTYYYAVSVPANTNKMLTVKAASSVATYTNVSVYPSGDSWNGVTGTDYVECSVNNTYDRTYIIRWTANETSTPITFTVDYKNLKAGDVITNPITAVLGKNTLEEDGTKYYTYTATRNGKLSIELSDPTMSVEFPRGTDSWSGTYEALVSGITYSLEATEGTSYLITVKNAKADEYFNLSETDFSEGEVKTNPISVEGKEYVLGKDQSNLWLKYTATKDCQLVIDCDAEYNGTNQVEYGKENEYMTGMVATKTDGSNYETYFHGTKVLKADETVLVHLKLTGNAEGVKVTFAEEDVPQGLSVDNPLTINVGETITIPAASEVWVKANLTKGDNTFTSNASSRTFLYYSLEDAQSGSNSEYVSYDTYYDPNDNYKLTATYKKTVNEDQTVYFQFPYVSYAFTFTFASDGTASGINDIHVNGGTVEVYNINGAKVADTTNGLKSGIYVVRQNGKAKKVVIK